MSDNLFIDTDIILDVFLKREEFFEASVSIFREYENGNVVLFTSPSIIVNTQYVGQRLISKKKCRSTINYLLNYFIILETNMSIIKKAYDSKFSDVEDAVQFYTATKDNMIDFFITRNTKDFKAAEKHLPVLTPSQFLKRI